MIGSAQMSKHYEPGEVVNFYHNGGRYGLASDQVYSFDTARVFGPDHAYAMCVLGSVVGWHVKGGIGCYVAGWCVYTDEVDRLQIEIDEGRTEFWIEEKRS